LAFEDVDDDTLGVRVATKQQVEEAISFARTHSDKSMLVHCFHGVGRSAAIALAVIADRLGPGFEREALDQLVTMRPEVTPNLVVVKLADEILQRQGDLIAAVQAWEVNAPGLKEKREARLHMVRNSPYSYSWN